MSDGLATALAACPRHDARHTHRLARRFERLSERPVSRSPTAWPGGAEPGAAYDFLDHPALGLQEMLAGHPHATRERRRAQAGVVLGHDTPCLHDGTPHPQAGVGPRKHPTREASLLHPPVGCTPARVT
jgi:hypothetical protein